MLNVPGTWSVIWKCSLWQGLVFLNWQSVFVEHLDICPGWKDFLFQSKHNFICRGLNPKKDWTWEFWFCLDFALLSVFVGHILFKKVLLEDKVLSLVNYSMLWFIAYGLGIPIYEWVLYTGTTYEWQLSKCTVTIIPTSWEHLDTSLLWILTWEWLPAENHPWLPKVGSGALPSGPTASWRSTIQYIAIASFMSVPLSDCQAQGGCSWFLVPTGWHLALCTQ